MKNEKPTYKELAAVVESFVYAFPARIGINNLLGGAAASAVWRGWNILDRLKSRWSDDPEYTAEYVRQDEQIRRMLDILDRDRKAQSLAAFERTR